MFGINLNPVLPVRVSPAEQAEMCTQLLFGEFFTILENTEKWCFIHNGNDHYKGWIDKKMITYIDEKEFYSFSSHAHVQIFKPVAECFIHNKNEPIILPAGSFLHAYDNETGTASIKENTYAIPTDAIMKRASQPASGNLIVSIAKSFLNAPYLWGGKTVFGIDCSGLVQVCFGICGIGLPRDANQQALKGELIGFLQEAETGDLAFFENEEGKIIHVGILLNNSTIIHTSGRVKIDSIDANGIISQKSCRHSHKLSLIRRFVK